ncbi:LysR substrate-binding domain-containing protein (plasmid) [Tistrella mobilis]|uniref:LysR substrate-binding domain-containing protein n=1 Tax=Tistrella mobilis TaxID=171437 RepID=UPI000C0AF5D3|nr:LysR substrate-binding domain-containing protein [uncultured Tistrella sp.]MAM76570.1 LysR family transcriptional regulator [Tistrella sp.]
MAMPPNLDMDVLRTFVTGSTLGSFAKAAERIGRSPPAISLQLRKLEAQVGQTLFRKQGRGLVLTEAGEILLSYAKRLLELNDEAMMAMQRLTDMEGRVRLGIPQDFADTSLPVLLGRFSRAYPKIRVTVRVERGSHLVRLIEAGDLDLALTWGDLSSTHHSVIGSFRVVWIGPDAFDREPDMPVPLVAFDPPCSFRARAIDALEKDGIAWEHVFASSGLAGLWAAVTAGLGITARIADVVPSHLRILDATSCGLPALGTINLGLHLADATPSSPVKRFSELLVETVSDIR